MYAPFFVRITLGATLVFAGIANDAMAAPATSLFDVVRRYADTMLERGRDTYGPQKTGLFLSALDRTTLSPLTSRPVAPGGIRREDRSGEPWSALTGANPQLDQNLLRILYAFSEITGDRKYGQAADEELSWFLKNARSPKTNLLPWGEHMSWEVMEDRPISGGTNLMVHEFARPWVLWDRCFALAPEESRQFALALWEHQIADQKTGGFDRHAPYDRHGPVDGKDFPRHAGFYIATWGHAYKHTKDETFLRAIETLLTRFERKRVQRDGTNVATIGSLDCETAAALVSEPLATRLRTFAAREDDLILVDLRQQNRVEANTPTGPPLWQTGYSAGTKASTAMLCLGRFEQVGKKDFRDALISIADQYVDSSPDEDLDAWPMAMAHAISTQAAAYRFTEKPVYLAEAQRLAKMAVDVYWQDNPLPRASLKSGHYEAITGADSLALALLEVHAITNPMKVKLPRNTIDR